jgi:hypothetical protein
MALGLVIFHRMGERAGPSGLSLAQEYMQGASRAEELRAKVRMLYSINPDSPRRFTSSRR